jgi:hypothetical protein
MSYIVATDITDKVVQAFIAKTDARMVRWMAATDAALESLGKQRGIQPASISATLDFIVSQWCCAMYCFFVCRDNMSSNPDVTIEQDKYAEKADFYRSEADRLAQFITREMLIGITALSPMQMVQGVDLIRG